MIVLENRYKIGTYIIIEEDTWSIKQEKVNKMLIQGIGGFTDKHELIGIYIKEKYYFIYNNKKYEFMIDNFECKNEYISKTEREFKVIISNQIVCKIRYIPFIDPGFLWYDADVEEFDFLLQFYNLVKDKTSIYNIIKYIQKKQT